MSEDQLKTFLEALKSDKVLQERLKSATNFECIVAIAKEEGFSFSAEELKKSQLEISEEELEGVAGGNISIPLWKCPGLDSDIMCLKDVFDAAKGFV